MIKSQGELWKLVRSGLTPLGVELQRIESGGTSRGIFDVNALWKGVEVWLELKVGDDGLSAEQKAWCVRRIKAGGRAFILRAVGVETGRLELWDGAHAVIKGEFPKLPQYLLYSPYDWELMAEWLFTAG
jgi:hypothetical protein